MSSDATFDKHIQIIAAKGKRLSGWALRVFDSRDQTLMLTLLKSLIIPTLEFCSPLWFPIDQKNINTLESIQRSFTSKIYGMSHLDYWQRLKKLDLYSLERRRERYVVIYIWKIWKGLVPNPGINPRSFEPENGVFFYLPQLYKGKGPGSSAIRKLKEHSILYQGVRLFNSLPTILRTDFLKADNTPPTVNDFKDKLDKYIKTLPDQPRIEHPRAAASNSIIDQKAYIIK